jgi:NADH/NAD ratio-sensing transcriptional regulator Rex
VFYLDCLAGLLLGGGPVTAQEPAGEVPAFVSTKEFRLIHRQGHTRALLSLNEVGQPSLHMRDEFDTDRVWVGISTETGVAVHDVDGKTRLVLSVDQDGLPSLVVRDRKQQTKSFHP